MDERERRMWLAVGLAFITAGIFAMVVAATSLGRSGPEPGQSEGASPGKSGDSSSIASQPSPSSTGETSRSSK